MASATKTKPVIVPEGMTVSGGNTGEKKAFDSFELTPSKLSEAEQIRFLGYSSTGHMAVYYGYPSEKLSENGELVYAGQKWSESWPANPEGIARKTDWSVPGGKQKIDGEFEKPRATFVAVVWSYTRQRPELLVITQLGLRASLGEILGDEDYSWSEDSGHPISDFVITLKKTGSGKESQYSALPKTRKIEPEVANAFAEIAERCTVDKLLAGGHPIRDLKAAFSHPADVDKEESF